MRKGSLPDVALYRSADASVEKEYKKSLREIVKIVALYPRDREWMAPALYLEAQIYFTTGLIAQAEQVAQELRWSYPDSEWMKKVWRCCSRQKEG